MPSRIPSLLTAGALVLTGGVAGVALGVTGSATAASVTPAPDTGTRSTAPDRTAEERDLERAARIRAELDSLVSAGTITDAQADAVAQRLADALPGRGGHHHGHGRGGQGAGLRLLTPEATASALGIPVEELRAAREAGKTLAQVAAEEGISRSALIDRLVAAAETALETAVAEGRLTQAQADETGDGLEARIAAKVDSVRPSRGGRPAPAAPSTPDAEESATTEPSGFVTSA